MILQGVSKWGAFLQPSALIIVQNLAPDRFENDFGIGRLGFSKSPWGSGTASFNLWVFCVKQTQSLQITVYGGRIYCWMGMHQDIFSSYRDYYNPVSCRKLRGA